MIQLQPYPEYKDSGVPWIETIPNGWNILRAKNVFTPIDIRSDNGQEELLSVSEKQGVSLRKNVNVTMFQAASYSGYKLCWPGDLVINSLWAWMQGLGFSKYHGIISTAYGVYRPRRVYCKHYEYFNYLIRSVAYKWELRVRSKGIWKSRYQLTDDAFLTMPILVPPPEDQMKITMYLQSEESRINKFIRNKRRLIALLKEQKQNVINQAVTRGINPDVKLIATGKLWPLVIPQHWTLEPLYARYSLQLGKMLDAKRITGQNSGYYLRNQDVQWGNINTSDLPQMDFSEGDKINFLLQKNDLLVCEGGEPGRTAMWDGKIEECYYQKALHRLRPKSGRDFPFYFYYVMKAAVNESAFAIGTDKATISHLTAEKFRRFRFPFPNREEQEQIVQFIEHETSIIDLTISRTEREIELIREYRTRLISDVVTGKVDVRNIEVETVAEEELIEEVEDREEQMSEEEDLVEEVV